MKSITTLSDHNQWLTDTVGKAQLMEWSSWGSRADWLIFVQGRIFSGVLTCVRGSLRNDISNGLNLSGTEIEI